MTDNPEQAAAAGAATGAAEGDKQFTIQKIYLKDSSFEAPNTPQVFAENWQPEVNLNLQTRNALVGENLHEVVLSITAEAKLGETTAFLVEVQQTGLFVLAGFTNDEARRLIGSYCPNMLFPYAREAISDLVSRGGFPALTLQPVNFDVLYDKQVQEMSQATAEAGATPDKH